MTTNDGGPAFPVESYDVDEDMDTVKMGMSLRDWFAGQALIGLASKLAPPTQSGADAYQYADAMLKARGEPVSADGLAEPSNASPIELGSIPGAVR